MFFMADRPSFYADHKRIILKGKLMTNDLFSLMNEIKIEPKPSATSETLRIV